MDGIHPNPLKMSVMTILPEHYPCRQTERRYESPEYHSPVKHIAFRYHYLRGR